VLSVSSEIEGLWGNCCGLFETFLGHLSRGTAKPFVLGGFHSRLVSEIRVNLVTAESSWSLLHKESWHSHASNLYADWLVNYLSSWNAMPKSFISKTSRYWPVYMFPYDLVFSLSLFWKKKVFMWLPCCMSVCVRPQLLVVMKLVVISCHMKPSQDILHKSLPSVMPTLQPHCCGNIITWMTEPMPYRGVFPTRQIWYTNCGERNVGNEFFLEIVFTIHLMTMSVAETILPPPPPPWIYSPLLHLSSFFSFFILYAVGRTPCTGISPSQGSYLQ
jgi:hypothetical protein